MSKIILSIFFTAFLFISAASDVFACSCLSTADLPIERQVKNAYTKSASVFIGEVTEIVRRQSNQPVLVKFKVEKSWAKRFQKEIIVSTNSNSAACGYEFQIGKKYLVYAYGKTNSIETNICTRTALAEANKDVAILNKIQKPKLKSSPK